MKDCKFYNKHLETIKEYISCLYELEGCNCGGICHIITDDNNIRDCDMEWVLNECEKDENKDREEIELAKLICKELLKLTVQERVLLFTYMDYYYVVCDKLCDKCNIYNEIIDGYKVNE